ncbi:hypothetical protein ABFS82_03G009300 [Erythranthe guttata]
MAILIHCPCNSKSTFFNSSPPFTNPAISTTTFPPAKTPKKPHSSNYCRTSFPALKLSKFRRTHITFCTKNGVFEEFKDTLLSRKPENEEPELLNKPSPKQANPLPVEETEQLEPDKPDKNVILEPFYKFFRPLEEEINRNNIEEEEEGDDNIEKVGIEYYEPKPGDLVVGVVVSGNENKLDVNVGADTLGTMLTKEVLPLYDKEMDYLLCDVESDSDEFFVRGKVGLVRNDVAMSGERGHGRPVVDPGTILFAEVLGRTLGGRPLISTRRLFRRIAWHRVRQIKQLDEPIEVKITEWNTGGLLTRIENKRRYKNDLILSEKEAWEMMHLQPGTLLEGTVRKLYPYGAQIRIGDTNRRLFQSEHISVYLDCYISLGKITSVSDVLTVGEEVKVVVVKSMFHDKISLSIAELESEPGLFLSNKEIISAVSAKRKLEPLPTNGLPFEDEEKLYSNWKWFKFERDIEI